MEEKRHSLERSLKLWHIDEGCFIGISTMTSGREGAAEVSEDTEPGRDFCHPQRKINLASEEKMIPFAYFLKMKH